MTDGPIIDLNGDLIPAGEARLDPFDRGFTLGDGIFESVRVENSLPKDLAAHLVRLRDASRVTNIPLPFSDSEIEKRVTRLCAVTGQQEGALRLTVSRGPATRGVASPTDCRPTVMMALHPLPPGRHDPVSAVISTATRLNEFSPLCRIKAAPYLDNILALDDAKAKGADDAILLNTQGRVVSAAYANLFAVIDGNLVTPPLGDGPLPGVTRACLIEGLGVNEQSLLPDDLKASEEIFLSNSMGIRPVRRLDGQDLSASFGWADKARELAG